AGPAIIRCWPFWPRRATAWACSGGRAARARPRVSTSLEKCPTADGGKLTHRRCSFGCLASFLRERERVGEEAGLPFLLEAVALAADVDDVGVVEQAVEDGACDHRVAAEDLAPGTEAFVAGQDDAATFVAARDHLEEQIALELVERQIADLVDDEQARVRVDLELLLEPVLLEGPRKRADQVVGGGKEHAAAGFGGLQAESDADHRLSGAGWADQDDVLG